MNRPFRQKMSGIVALVCIALGLAFSSASSAQPTIEWSQVGPGGRWGAIATSHDGSIVYAGDSLSDNLDFRRKMIRSLDGGNSWVVVANAPTLEWIAIDISADGQFIYAVGDTSADLNPTTWEIHRSADAGQTWSRVAISAVLIRDIAVSEDGTSFIVLQDDGHIRISSHSGTQLAAPIQVNAGMEDYAFSIAMSGDGQYVYVAHLYGALYKSTNFGATWTMMTGSNSRDWTCIATSRDGQTVLATAGDLGQSPTLYLSFNAGSTFTNATNVSDNFAEDHTTYCSVSDDGMHMTAGSYLSKPWVSLDKGGTWNVFAGDSTALTNNIYPGLKASISGNGSRLLLGLEAAGGDSGFLRMVITQPGPPVTSTTLGASTTTMAPLVTSPENEVVPAIDNASTMKSATREKTLPVTGADNALGMFFLAVGVVTLGATFLRLRRIR
jgi:hypothetical protein